MSEKKKKFFPSLAYACFLLAGISIATKLLFGRSWFRGDTYTINSVVLSVGMIFSLWLDEVGFRLLSTVTLITWIALLVTPFGVFLIQAAQVSAYFSVVIWWVVWKK